MDAYYFFTVDAGYCGCDNDYLVHRAEPFATELEIAKYLDYLSGENAEECLDYCLTEEEQEDIDRMQEYFDNAMCLGHYSSLTEKEVQGLLAQGYVAEEAIW